VEFAVVRLCRVATALLVATSSLAHAQSTQPAPQANAPIVPDAEFDKALPPLSDDLNAPLEPMPAPEAEPAPTDPQIDQPLPPISSFETAPLETAADAKGADARDRAAPEIRYETVLRGMEEIDPDGQFNALSALKNGGGKAANATQISARAHEDEALAVRLMKALGYYDGAAHSVIEPIAGETGKVRAIVTATPGKLYHLGAINIVAAPTVPPGLVRRQLRLKTGDPIEAARIQAAEANVSLKLPQRGYPFAKVGDRDILIDDDTLTGDYTLPVETGPRGVFGKLRTSGREVFDLKHLSVFPRFRAGDLYDSRKTDDLRQALAATGLFNSVSVQPVATGEAGPDGTEKVDLLIRQSKGKTRSLAATAGYGTGEGIKLEGTWTSRNLFPPEGALILAATAGTQQQGGSATFRRANAGKRDRTFSILTGLNHQNYDAFDAFTGTVGVRWSYDSTPLWQKKLTYSYGADLTGTNESVYDFARGDRVRRTYGIAALPVQVLWDTSNDLLNPTRGYRVKVNLSPETSVQGAVAPYVRAMVEGTFYYPVSRSLVIAGRARAGSIMGIARDDLAPSRRYYGGGGGSVRGFGYQRLGPFDPNGDPVGGRSLNEFAVEARYRFGDFGIVPFIDAGNAYESVLPKGNDLRFGAGIGGRFYTNFGPMRVDIATPLNPRKGDGKIALYISIGQAF